jgi:hypothetical protein
MNDEGGRYFSERPLPGALLDGLSSICECQYRYRAE